MSTPPTSPDSTQPKSSQATAAPLSKDASADEIESDIERTRADLGDTVDALTQKLDVKSQAQHKVQEVKNDAAERARTAKAGGEQALARVKTTVLENTTDDAGKVKPAVPAGAASVLAILATIAALVWRGRHARRRRLPRTSSRYSVGGRSRPAAVRW